MSRKIGGFRPTLLALGLMLASAAASRAQEAELKGIGHVLGDPDAPVLVVEYGDFACSACALFATGTWPDIRREFVETGRVRWRMVPFDLGFRNGEEGARAGECAASQGMFWEMHDALFEHRDTWVDERSPTGPLEDLARATGLNVDAFRACYDEKRFEGRIEAANRAADAAGVRGTPTFFINGIQAVGALPVATFRSLLKGAEPTPH